MEQIASLAIMGLTVYTVTGVILGEYWRGKRSKRPNYRRTREAREAKMVAWLKTQPHSPPRHPNRIG